MSQKKKKTANFYLHKPEKVTLKISQDLNEDPLTKECWEPRVFLEAPRVTDKKYPILKTIENSKVES